MSTLRLKIEPVIRNAEDVKKRVERELPHHTGLISLAEGVAAAARKAEHAAEQLRKPLGWHRLPVMFLAMALLILSGWIYMQFFYRVPTLKVAIPDRDAQELRDRLSGREGRLQEFEQVIVAGSHEAVEKVKKKATDLGFVQGGIEIPRELPRLETPNAEIVLWFIRDSISDPAKIRRILTSLSGAGSHSVAKAFVKAWKLDPEVQYVHDWTKLTADAPYTIPDSVDAVFVVKDLSDENTLRAVDRLASAGFRLASPNVGARLAQLDYLTPYTIAVGYLRSIPPFPAEPVQTYSVMTYLIARKGMTPRMLAAASHLIDRDRELMSDGRYEPTLGETSELLQGVDAFLGILINIVLAFLALMGLEMFGYRKRFHELNSLISLISIHQSSKDVLGHADNSLKRDHLLYLSLCSDLLGLVSMIAGYYTQENSSLLFNGMPEIIHQRCDGLKINIQLKILHATIQLDHAEQPKKPDSEPQPKAAENVS